MTMNLAEMQAEVAEVNRSKGWYDEERTFGELIALLHSEVSEALEEYRKHFFYAYLGEGGKPEGVGSELADVLIRLLDMAERYGTDLNLEVAYHAGRYGVREKFGDQVTVLHILISRMAMAWDSSVTTGLDEPVGRFMAAIFVYLAQMASFNNIDLEAEYARKFAYNKTRPYRHGNKHL